MSAEIPVQSEEPRLPYTVLSELNIILDETQPLPKRAALLVKWLAFFNARSGGRVEVPQLEELTPSRLREHALRLTAVVAEYFFSARRDATNILNQF